MTRIKNKLIYPRPPLAIILMYHRINEMHYDPWDLCVSETHFEEHLRLLAKDYEVYPLECLSTGALRRDKSSKKIFVTFDDGYLDNYEKAVPLLKKWGIPATFFIPTQIINSKKLFWWEMVDYIFGKEMALPERFHLSSGENDFTRILSDKIRNPDLNAANKWSANTMSPPTERCHFYLELCEWIKKRTAGEQEEIVNLLIDQFLTRETQNMGFDKMPPEHIASLSVEGFGIGAHTVRHSSLQFQNPKVQQQEISASKAQLEELTGRPITTFAYPHGDYDQQSRELVQESGFSLACTTQNRGLYDKEDLYTLPRVWVYNCNAERLKQQLDYFFTR